MDKYSNKKAILLSYFKCVVLPSHLVFQYFTALFLAVSMPVFMAAGIDPIKFDFGDGATAAGYIKITPDNVYSERIGYGFEPGQKIYSTNRNRTDVLLSDFVSCDKPFYFSVKLPEGNYGVKVILGDYYQSSSTTIKAELRRLVVWNAQTRAGEFVTNVFYVNIRTPRLSTGEQVKLKSREKTDEFLNWDDKLTLEFNGDCPKICAIEVFPADNITTIYLLGDSTVCDQPFEPWCSWGQMLPLFLHNVAIANYAESGESLRSSYSALRLSKVLDVIKPGDYVFIQFGHNDQKDRTPGAGAFTTYSEFLRRYVKAIRDKKANPVLITSMHRRTFDESGKITNSLGDYPAAVRAVAAELKAPLIDLNNMSKNFYEALGKDGSKAAFQDGTHHNNYGAFELARCVVNGIEEGLPELRQNVVSKFKGFDPSTPDLLEKVKIPPSPSNSLRKPEGN
ncbi:MAG: rhamnogalacturonan acetylesterase [Verrucomicrobiia bacterium]